MELQNKLDFLELSLKGFTPDKIDGIWKYIVPEPLFWMLVGKLVADVTTVENYKKWKVRGVTVKKYLVFPEGYESIDLRDEE